ncbi:tetratricopeptide repeat protein [Melioribacteraceae bacterium 4301-Me]|uniref:tetratricopeptide repeat protein n=1 Tax=Pyranulibacter aquaticus TaxID=3163344 RepID=UPI003594FE1D
MYTKKNIFRLILIITPFSLLFLLEMALRISGYENELQIVSTIKRNGKSYYTMNQLVGKRYFGKDRFYYRKGTHDFFEVNKSPNTIRVFCFGASTTAGFPYEYNATPAEFLRERLSAAFPDKNIEVINTAIDATNSFTVVEFAKELVNYEPDLFVVYMGQNEFYGVYGVGSTISVGKSRWLIKTNLWLQNFKTFLLIKNFIRWITEFVSKSRADDNKILMEQMAENNSIIYGDEDYRIAKENFTKNYEEIIEIAKENNVPLIVSTLVTNEKDLFPFVTMYSNNIDTIRKNKCKEYYRLGLVSKANKDYKTALDYFKKSIEIDSLPANVHFELGKIYLELGDNKNALSEFTKAVDFDGLKFRAPSEFNTIVKKLSIKYNLPLADVNKMFRQHSKDGIIGDELLVDHIHPNIKGYFLLAKSWFEAIKENNLLGKDFKRDENDSLLWENIPVTELDSVIGEFKIRLLRSRPPFQERDQNLIIQPKNFIEQQAYLYSVEHQISWGLAHLNVEKEYLLNKNYEKAAKELKAILVTDDKNSTISIMLGDIYLQTEDYQNAERYYLADTMFFDNQLSLYKMGIVEINLGKYDQAIEYLNRSLFLYQYQQFLRPSQIEDVHFNLAFCYSKLNKYDKAVDELKIILKSDPKNQKAKQLLKSIEASFKDKQG